MLAALSFSFRLLKNLPTDWLVNIPLLTDGLTRQQQGRLFLGLDLMIWARDSM